MIVGYKESVSLVNRRLCLERLYRLSNVLGHSFGVEGWA